MTTELEPEVRRRRRRGDSRSARERHQRVLDRRKDRWLNAPISPGGLKPVLDLANDIARQRRGDTNFDPLEFWRDLEESVRRGFFDGEHRLLIVARDRRWRLTSSLMREVEQWPPDAADLRFAIFREGWASVASLVTWAKHLRYEVPVAWREAMNSLQDKPTISEVAGETDQDPSATGRKRAKKLEAVIECLQRIKPAAALSQEQVRMLVNEDLKLHGQITVSLKTLQTAQKKAAKTI